MLARNPLSLIRRKAGFRTQGAAARALKISSVHLSAVESGKATLSTYLQRRLAQLYRVNSDSLRVAWTDGRKDYLERATVDAGIVDGKRGLKKTA